MEAIILAGGLGTRLKQVVRDVPKSMALVNGRPFLEYLLDFLMLGGINRAILSVGYMHEAIISHFGRSYRSMRLDYAIEEEPLGTGGGIRLSFWKVHGDRAFVFNGDSIFRFHLKGMAEYHAKKDAEVTIALRRIDDTGRYGRVTRNRSGRITGFAEKKSNVSPGFISAGVYIIEKQFLLDPGFRGRFSIEKDCFEPLAGKADIFGYPATGYFLDIGIPADYQKAQDDFKELDNRS